MRSHPIDPAEIAPRAIERHLGDVIDSDDSADAIYEEAYTIALDALVDSGLDFREAGTIASAAAQSIAQL
jgi:hypothetical protein